ncbi:sigma-70 family RNA polymerase sigma factor [bacterium]|nr:sigma-70 family RNA polymerase sigma factor [bacterium]
MTSDSIEKEIRKLIKDDDSKALEIIYDCLGRKLYGYLLTILCSEEKAEDVMQNVFVKIAEKRDRIAGVNNITGYIFAMARNEAMDYFRKQPKHHEDISKYENILCVKEEHKDKVDAEEIKGISKSLESLPYKQSEVISMKIFQDMTFEEISRALKISQNTAASRYRYGIEKLKNKLTHPDPLLRREGMFPFSVKRRG